MTASKEILEFLTQPENLPLALEVADYVEDLKRSTHLRFWELFNIEMKDRLNNSSIAKTWRFQLFSVKQLRKDWQRSYLEPAHPDAPSHLRFAVGQGSQGNKYRLFCGVTWTTPPEDFDHPQLTHLKGLVIAAGMTVMEPPLWLGWNYLPFIPFTYEFISAVHNDGKEYVFQASQVIWEKFCNLQPEMDAVNQLIKA